MIKDFFRDFFQSADEWKPRENEPFVIVHRGRDGEWYAKAGFRVGNDFDAKFVLSVEEGSTDREEVEKLVETFFPSFPVKERT